MICLQIVKWLQQLLFSTNYAIKHYSFVWFGFKAYQPL